MILFSFCQKQQPILLFLLSILFLRHDPVKKTNAWTTITSIAGRTSYRSWTSTSLSAAAGGRLPDGYQEYGDSVIKRAAKNCGMDDSDVDNNLSIEWKAGRIIVTVRSENVILSADDEEKDGSEDYDDDDDDELYEDDEIMEIDDEMTSMMDLDRTEEDYDEEEEEEEEDHDDTNDNNSSSSDSSGSSSPSSSSSTTSTISVDVTQLAKAINSALDDDGVGRLIAETHGVEVTTPGASNEIVGPIMYNAYKGFEVVCTFLDPKTKKQKTIDDGRLVERNDDFTVLSIKGRMKKIKNDNVISVRLPKAKKEKGAA
jgi:ribosome maturation factor RimP